MEISNALTEELCDCCWGVVSKLVMGLFSSPISTAQGWPVSVPRAEFFLHALSTLLAAIPYFWPPWNKIPHIGCGFFQIRMNGDTICLCKSPKLKERHTTVQRSDGKGEAGSHALKRCWVHASVSCTCFFQASINLLFLSMQKLPHLAKKNDKFCLSWTEPSGFTGLK